MALSLHHLKARGWLLENICMQHRPGLAGPRMSQIVLSVRPELPIGCLVVSAGQDSIFDWLLSGHSELEVATARWHFNLSWIEQWAQSLLCFFFFFGAVYLFLPVGGLVAKHLSFFRSAPVFEGFGSFVPNTVTQEISFKAYSYLLSLSHPSRISGKHTAKLTYI